MALGYKVDGRRPEDFAPVQEELRHAIGAAALLLYLKTDLCRRDLPVQIQAVGK